MLLRSCLSAFVLVALAPVAAQAQTTQLYSQNFEAPGGGYPAKCADINGDGSTGAGNMGWSDAAHAYSTTTAPFVQRNTADVICIAQVGAPDDVTDPQAKGGNYAIGFHGGNPERTDYGNTVESIGYVFDPQSKSLLKGSFDASLMGLPGRTAAQFGYPSTAVAFKVDFYEVPAGTANIDIEAATAFGQQLHARFGGVVQTPFESLNKSISNANPESQRFTLDWHAMDFEIDLRKMANPGSRVMMVLTGLPEKVYMAIDNISVSVAPNVVTVPSTTVLVQPGTTGTFDTAPGTSNALNLPVTVDPAFTVDDPDAGTVELIPGTSSFSFTPKPGFSGQVTVMYRACDAEAPTCSAYGSIVFDVPAPLVNNVTVPSTTLTVQPGTTGSFDTTPGTSDTLGLPITVDPNFTVDNPNAGTVELIPGTGNFTFTPHPGFTGDVTVSYRACDNRQPPTCSADGTIVFQVPGGTTPPGPGPTNPASVPVGGPASLVGLSLLIGWGMRRQQSRRKGGKAEEPQA